MRYARGNTSSKESSPFSFTSRSKSMINERPGFENQSKFATFVGLQGIPSQHTHAIAIKEGREG